MLRYVLALVSLLSGSAAMAQGLDFGPPVSVDQGLTAAGTTQANAYVIKRRVNVFSTVASGAGAVLPSSDAAGVQIEIWNNGANALLIYPGRGGAIDALGTNTAFSLGAGAEAKFTNLANPTSATATWVSALYGAGTTSFASPTLTGTTTAATINASGPLTVAATIASFAANPTPAINCFICFGPTITYDPSTGGGSGDDRWTGVFSTISPSTSTADLWENFNSFLYINGPGTMSHEINILHDNGQIFPGATWTSGEGLESSMFNQGTISGNYDGSLTTIDNQSAATAVTLRGFHALLKQDNAAGGAVGTWEAFECDNIGGAGSNPTNDYCLRNDDANATIATLGNVLIGGVGFPAAGASLDIHATDSAGGTLGLRMQNSSAVLQFYVTNSGNAFFQQKVSLGSGTTAGFIQFQTTTSGDQVLLQAGPGNGAGATNVLIPQGTATTLAGLAVVETFTAAQTFSGTVNITGTLSGNSVAAVSCTSGGVTAATMVVSNGIVTHC